MTLGALDTYHIEDARDILSVLPPSRVIDTTVTSPPYWNLKDYGSKKQLGFGQQYETYLDDLEEVFSGVYKITKKTGSLWIVIDTIKHNGELKLLPFDLARRLKRVGWILHDIIIWHKDKTLPWSHRGKLRNIFEYILFFSREKHFKYYLSEVRETEGLKEWWMRYPERYSPRGKAPTRTWSIPIPRQGSWGENWVRHFCPFPPQLVSRIVRLTTKKGDVVLDPFAGSGVVLAQAKALKRRYLGFDLRQAYRRMFDGKVLPSIVALQQQGGRWQHGEERKRRAFSSLIWKLPKTKHPRELLRLYEKRYGRTSVAGVIALSRKMHSLNIVFIFPNGKRPPNKFLARMRELLSRAPLSKYGLRATVAVEFLDSRVPTRSGLKSREALNLYRDGKTYRVSGRMTTRRLLESLRGGPPKRTKEVPIIASNVRVNVARNASL